MTTLVVCAWCGKVFDLEDHTKANYYEDQHVEIKDGYLITHAKIQHIEEPCMDTMVVEFMGTINKRWRR